MNRLQHLGMCLVSITPAILGAGFASYGWWGPGVLGVVGSVVLVHIQPSREDLDE